MAVIICGDLYNKRIAKWMRQKRSAYLFVTVTIEYSPEYGQPSEEDVKVMAEWVRLLGVKAFNSQ